MCEPSVRDTGSVRTVQILSVSPSDADHAALSCILQQGGAKQPTNGRWSVYPVSSLAGTVETLAEEEIPIIISECNLFPGTWREILEHISLLPEPPLLIVASRGADERLWAEALNLGAWDVLAKPFEREEVNRAVDSAWRHWQERHELPTRQYDAKQPKHAPAMPGGSR